MRRRGSREGGWKGEEAVASGRASEPPASVSNLFCKQPLPCKEAVLRCGDLARGLQEAVLPLKFLVKGAVRAPLRAPGGLIVSTQSSSPGHTGHMAETRVAAHTSCSIGENFMCLCQLPRDCCALFIAVSCCDYPTSIYAENTNCTHCLQRCAAHGFCFLDFTKII